MHVRGFTAGQKTVENQYRATGPLRHRAAGPLGRGGPWAAGLLLAKPGRSQIRPVVIAVADAGTNPDSVSPGAEHVIHAARWGISLLCVAVAN